MCMFRVRRINKSNFQDLLAPYVTAYTLKRHIMFTPKSAACFCCGFLLFGLGFGCFGFFLVDLSGLRRFSGVAFVFGCCYAIDPSLYIESTMGSTWVCVCQS